MLQFCKEENFNNYLSFNNYLIFNSDNINFINWAYVTKMLSTNKPFCFAILGNDHTSKPICRAGISKIKTDI